MPALHDLRQCAATLPDDSDAKRFLLWAEIHIGDLQDQVFELEDDLRRANEGKPFSFKAENDKRKDKQRRIFSDDKANK